MEPELTATHPPPERPEIVSVANAPGLAAALQTLGLDLLFEWEGRVFILAAAEDIRTLNKARIPYLSESHKFPALDPQPLHILGGINGDYHSAAELEADLQTLEHAFPQLARLSTIGISLENRNIYALKISDNVGQDEEEAEVLFLGCHHAREWISVEVPYLLARFLLENYASDPVVRRAVDLSEIWIVPLVNPDGLEYSIRFYRYWRKNRRLNPDGTYGVDLNRNYGYNWAYDDRGSSPEPASDVYRGEAPFSEPESRAVRDLFFQRDFQALVSYHSYSQVILYPWGFTTAPTDQDGLLESLAASMSDLMRAVNGRIYGFGRAGDSLYLTNGDTTDWAFGVAGISAFTIELPPVDQLGGGFFNAEADIGPIFRENVPAALALIDWSIGNF
ncbi:MAG: zinc carboxypeptidase, partial [Candidatus Aminicenantes bacterium]|nr:zinc carboxypeptidase [Candidatus Aminicenantes bacterium]